MQWHKTCLKAWEKAGRPQNKFHTPRHHRQVHIVAQKWAVLVHHPAHQNTAGKSLLGFAKSALKNQEVKDDTLAWASCGHPIDSLQQSLLRAWLNKYVSGLLPPSGRLFPCLSAGSRHASRGNATRAKRFAAINGRIHRFPRSSRQRSHRGRSR